MRIAVEIPHAPRGKILMNKDVAYRNFVHDANTHIKKYCILGADPC